MDALASCGRYTKIADRKEPKNVNIGNINVIAFSVFSSMSVGNIVF